MNEKKMVNRNAALALGITCVVLIALIAYFTGTGISAQNSYNHLQNQNKQLQTWLNQNASQNVNLQNQNSQLQTWLDGNKTLLNQTQANNTILQNQNTNLTNQLNNLTDNVSSTPQNLYVANSTIYVANGPFGNYVYFYVVNPTNEERAYYYSLLLIGSNQTYTSFPQSNSGSQTYLSVIDPHATQSCAFPLNLSPSNTVTYQKAEISIFDTIKGFVYDETLAIINATQP